MTKNKEKKSPAMSDKIPDALDNVAVAVLTTPPKKTNQWKYLKRFKK